MITCPKCAKENQDHYKFCLGCGAELPRDASPKKFAAGTPPHGVAAAPRALSDETTSLGTGSPGVRPLSVPAAPRPAAVPAPVKAPEVAKAPEAAPAPAKAPDPVMAAPTAPSAAAAPAPGASPPVICPQCEYPNPGNNKFCASCGFKLSRPQMPSAPPAAVGAPVASGAVLTALRADGSEAGSYSLPATAMTIGRDTGSIFSGDSYLSPRHASFMPRDGRLFVRDEGSLNGVYRKMHPEDPVPLQIGDIFRIGQELLRIEPLQGQPPGADGVERMGSPAVGYVGRIALVIGRDTTGNAFPIPESGLHLGRERGDVLFPEDGYVSGLHCRINCQNGQLFVTDLGSSNGSFMRLGGETELTNGDILLMGQQLFRVTL